MSRSHKIAAMLCALAFATSAGPPASSANEQWLDDLMLQLAVEEACDVAELLSSTEGFLGNNVFIDARVQCEDGRQFDASRLEPAEEFTLRICEVVEMEC